MTATQVSLAPRDKVSSRATRISLKKNSFDICVRFVNIRKFIQKTGLKALKHAGESCQLYTELSQRWLGTLSTGGISNITIF